jgi:hypothetical protein
LDALATSFEGSDDAAGSLLEDEDFDDAFEVNECDDASWRGVLCPFFSVFFFFS